MGSLEQGSKNGRFWLNGLFFSGLALIILMTWGTPGANNALEAEPCQQRLFAKHVQYNGQYCAKVSRCDERNSCLVMDGFFGCSKKSRQFIVVHNLQQAECFNLMAQETNGTSEGPLVRFCNLCEHRDEKQRALSNAQ